MNKVIYKVIFFLAVLISIAGCSDPDAIGVTGAAVTDQPSLLQIKVVDESGEPLGEADVYVNDVYKGKTNSYGESKGTKLVILNGKSNAVVIRSPGFFDSEPTKVSAASGEQHLTITLEKERSSYKLQVKNNQGVPLPSALVFLFSDRNKVAEQTAKTNKAGEAVFDKVDDGDYFLVISAPGYEEYSAEEHINFSLQAEMSLTAVLERLPHLDVEVVGHDGQKLSEAEVTLYTKEDHNTPGAFPLHISITDEKGVVTYDDVVLEEQYVILIKKEGYQAQIHEKTLSEEDQLLHAGMELVEE